MGRAHPIVDSAIPELVFLDPVRKQDEQGQGNNLESRTLSMSLASALLQVPALFEFLP